MNIGLFSPHHGIYTVRFDFMRYKFVFLGLSALTTGIWFYLLILTFLRSFTNILPRKVFFPNIKVVVLEEDLDIINVISGP